MLRFQRGPSPGNPNRHPPASARRGSDVQVAIAKFWSRILMTSFARLLRCVAGPIGTPFARTQSLLNSLSAIRRSCGVQGEQSMRVMILAITVVAGAWLVPGTARADGECRQA